MEKQDKTDIREVVTCYQHGGVLLSTKLRLFVARLGVMRMQLLVLVGLVACVPKFQAEYADPAGQEIVDDRWNETDARKSAEVLVSAVLKKPWLHRFVAINKRRPVVGVDEVKNKTSEHIDTKALTDYIRDELINSGKIRFVNIEQRQKLSKELKYQQSGAVSTQTRARIRKQIGIDYFFGGTLSSYEHIRGGLKTVTYQVVLNLTNLETSEIEWSQKHLIKKRFKRRDTKW